MVLLNGTHQDVVAQLTSQLKEFETPSRINLFNCYTNYMWLL